MMTRLIALPAFLIILGSMTAGVSANVGPLVDEMPYVNVATVYADGSTHYTVTMTAADGDGYNDIRELRVLFNITGDVLDPSTGRGYMAWGQTSAEITRFGGNWSVAAATGGGDWGYLTDNWGGTTYITPISASTSTSGSASGATGYRTVVWTFQAKPAWAFDPLVNDPDAWVADYAINSGWLDSPNEFDVVGASCPAYSATPSAPLITNVLATSVDLTVDPADSATDLFAIRVAPTVAGQQYVQPDGSIGESIAWQTKAQWSTVTILGLQWETEYTFSLRSFADDGTTCPSGWGPGTTVMTDSFVLAVDTEAGVPFSPGVRGNNPYRSVSAATYDDLWDLNVGSSGRGLAGGLDADTYDWRDINSGANWGLRGGYFTTLEFLRFARDTDSWPQFTANVFGGGYQDPGDGTFICQYDNPEGLAADWVRYANIILQNYRQGDEGTLTGEDLRVYNSISDWGGKDKLLAPGEAQTPTIQYWEIGNEPELGGFPTFLSNHYLSPTAYRDRYKPIAQAMLAVDPTIKVGPCLMNPADPAGSGQWLDALAADQTIPIDFVGYHPYYYDLRNSFGSPAGTTDALRQYKGYLQDRTAGIHDIMAQNNRSNYELMATEWNPMNWDASSTAQRSQPMALGLVEGVFTFAEEDVLAAHFWEQPQNRLGARDAMIGLRDYMGDTLLATTEDFGLITDSTNWRVYVTSDSTIPDRIVIWGLNFNEDEAVSVDLSLSGQFRIDSATLMHYGQPGDDISGGDTSLTDSSGMVWESAVITPPATPSEVSMTLEDAEMTLLVLETADTPTVDRDRDGDVDAVDFGAFQKCLSGVGIQQSDPDCLWARLDGDLDVDGADTDQFINCWSGPNMIANPTCLP